MCIPGTQAFGIEMFVAGLGSALSGMVIGGIISGIISAVQGNGFFTGFADGAITGFVDGFTSGAILYCISSAVSALLDKIADSISTDYNKYNYRAEFEKNMGEPLPKDFQAHHSIPQKYESLAKSKGINIHEPKYIRGVHKDLHIEVTARWNQFAKLNPNPTIKDVIKYAKLIDKQFSKFFIFPK